MAARKAPSTDRPTPAAPGRSEGRLARLAQREPGPDLAWRSPRRIRTSSTPGSNRSRKKGGIFRSTDLGDTWERRNDFDRAGSCTYAGICGRSDERRPHLRHERLPAGLATMAARRFKRLLGEKEHTSTITISGSIPKNKQPLPGRLRRRHLRKLRPRRHLDLQGQPARHASSTTSPWTKTAPFYHVYGGTQDNYSARLPRAHAQHASAHQCRLLRRPTAATDSTRASIRRIPTPSTPPARTPARPLRPAHRRARRHPAAAGQGRSAAALELGRALHHQPALPHAPLLRRQEALSQRRPRRFLGADQPRSHSPTRSQ